MTATATSSPVQMTEPSDQDLVARIAAADMQALGALFERYEPALRRYLARLGLTLNDADDLIQVTFLEVVRASSRFDPAYAVRPWVFGIATILARRHRRSLARAALLVTAWARAFDVKRRPTSTPDELYAKEEVARRIQNALKRLTPRKREVFVLVTLEGLSGEDAARALGIPVKTVWTRLHYARRELREALGDLL